jgi:uncharacterized membrane-anchored protein YitT (DUF2179 family)
MKHPLPFLVALALAALVAAGAGFLLAHGATLEGCGMLACALGCVVIGSIPAGSPSAEGGAP